MFSNILYPSDFRSPSDIKVTFYKSYVSPIVKIVGCSKQNTGLRKSRYEGTNQGTKGTVVNQTLLLLPRFPYKNIIIARYLDFRIEKNWQIEVQITSLFAKLSYCLNF